MGKKPAVTPLGSRLPSGVTAATLDLFGTEDGVFGTAGPKADSSFSKKIKEVIIEVYGMSMCIHESVTAI